MRKCTGSTYIVHSPTNALLINFVKSLKFILKYTIISLLHVLVFNDHHQGDLSVPNYGCIFVKTACHRAACRSTTCCHIT